MERLRAQNDEMHCSPPTDGLIAFYFEARGWWHPPDGGHDQQADGPPAPEYDLPEFEP